LSRRSPERACQSGTPGPREVGGAHIALITSSCRSRMEFHCNSMKNCSIKRQVTKRTPLWRFVIVRACRPSASQAKMCNGHTLAATRSVLRYFVNRTIQNLSRTCDARLPLNADDDGKNTALCGPSAAADSLVMLSSCRRTSEVCAALTSSFRHDFKHQECDMFRKNTCNFRWRALWADRSSARRA
jgi:hypothetical protein